MIQFFDHPVLFGALCLVTAFATAGLILCLLGLLGYEFFEEDR